MNARPDPLPDPSEESPSLDSESTDILFEEIETGTARLMQELASPEARKNRKIPFPVAAKLRQHQVARIEENIRVLRGKQAEFNRKMEDYVKSLEGLLTSLQESLDKGEDSPESSTSGAGGTYVRCIGCGTEKRFEDIHVLVALEPEDVLTRPTEVIAQVGEDLRKGLFRCPHCGSDNMTIRPL